MKKIRSSKKNPDGTTGKYEINPMLYFKNDAGLKAPLDADEIYRRNGFEVIRIPGSRALFRLLFALLLPFRLERGSEVHVQVTSSGLIKYLIKSIRLRGIRKLVLLIHDVQFLRYGTDGRMEVSLFNQADELIVHTDAMADALRKEGVRTPMKALTMFDYLSSSRDCYAEPDIRSLVFAGNLQKSRFINSFIRQVGRWRSPVYFYGDGGLPEAGEECPGARYEGVFSPNDISIIKGAWGLVWDGSEPDTCDPYLKYNSPHKLSLYLASEKPVIIWKQSALSTFVTVNGLGISVDSLHEIPDRLLMLTEEDYAEYRRRVLYFSTRLREGSYLSAAL